MLKLVSHVGTSDDRNAKIYYDTPCDRLSTSYELITCGFSRALLEGVRSSWIRTKHASVYLYTYCIIHAQLVPYGVC